jgi:hypothetical protein
LLQVAAAQFTAIVGQLALRVADSPKNPTWYAESFYSGLSQRVQSAAR